MLHIIAVRGQVIHYYGTDYTIRSLTVDDNGVATVDLDPSNETIVSAIQEHIARDEFHNINFAQLEKELNAATPPGS